MSAHDTDAGYPELATARLRLRGFRRDDLPYLQAFAVRPALWRYLPGPEVTAELVEAFLEAQLIAQAEPGGRDWQFCVEHGGFGLPIGTARVSISSPEHRQGTVALSIDSDHWRQGYGREVLAVLTEMGFSDLGLHRLSALADTENLAGRRLLLAGGYAEEGILRGNFQLRGSWRDTALFARINPAD